MDALMSGSNRASTFAEARLLSHALKFGAVGVLGVLVDVGVFNLLRLGIFDFNQFLEAPLGAKIVSVTISTLISWFGNRYWTFSEDRRRNFVLELLEFCTIAVVGMGISLGCLYISHYVLGFRSLLADNVSANVIGLGLATVFRFLLYRYWVYGHYRSDGLAARTRQAEEATRMESSATD